MNSKAGNGQNNSLLSSRTHKDDECAKRGCSYADDHVKVAEDLRKKFKEIHLLRKCLDFFENMLTEMKKLNSDKHVSESDPMSLVDHLKFTLCDMDKVARSDLPATNSSALNRILCELTDNFSQLDNMVNRAEKVFSGKTVQNLKKLLDDCEKNMLGFQISLKEFQYIEVMERKIDELLNANKKLLRLNDTISELNKTLIKDEKNLMEKYDKVYDRLFRTEDLIIELLEKRYFYSGKRRNSW